MKNTHFIIHVSESIISHLLTHYANNFLDECILIKKWVTWKVLQVRADTNCGLCDIKKCFEEISWRIICW